MITTTPTVTAADWEAATGWHLETQGLCLGDRCVPVAGITTPDGRLDVVELAHRTGRPVAHDEQHDVWAVGPESEAPGLRSTRLPNLVLEDRNGLPVALHGLLGRRLVVHAWASW